MVRSLAFTFHDTNILAGSVFGKQTTIGAGQMAWRKHTPHRVINQLRQVATALTRGNAVGIASTCIGVPRHGPEWSGSEQRSGRSG